MTKTPASALRNRRNRAAAAAPVHRPRAPLRGAYGIVFRFIADGVRAQLPRVDVRVPSARDAAEMVRGGDAPEMELSLGRRAVGVREFVNWGDTLEIEYDCMRQHEDGTASEALSTVAYFCPLGAASLQIILGSIVALIVAALRPEPGAQALSAAEAFATIRAAPQDQLRVWADELCSSTCQPGCRFAGDGCAGNHPVAVQEDPASIIVRVAVCGACTGAEPNGTTVIIPHNEELRIPAVHRSLVAFVARMRAAQIAMA